MLLALNIKKWSCLVVCIVIVCHYVLIICCCLYELFATIFVSDYIVLTCQMQHSLSIYCMIIIHVCNNAYKVSN